MKKIRENMLWAHYKSVILADQQLSKVELKNYSKNVLTTPMFFKELRSWQPAPLMPLLGPTATVIACKFYGLLATSKREDYGEAEVYLYCVQWESAAQPLKLRHNVIQRCTRKYAHGKLLQQLLEVCILRLVLVSCCSPLSNGLPMEDQDLHKIKSFTSSCDLEQPTWKNVSMSKIRSGCMELVSSRTGSGGPEKL